MKMNDKTYDVMKHVSQIILPAMGTLYFALAELWNFPYAEEIVGSLTAVDAFLGTLLHVAQLKYAKEGKNDA